MQDIPSFLRSHGIRLNKDLGQHFLKDQAILKKIVETADIKPEDHIVEIGAGIGVLTSELTKKAKCVTSIEIDERMISLLNEYTQNPTNLTVIQGNALKVPFPNESYKIVANIPYHITSPLLRHAFLESERKPESMTLLIQKEVAEKICEDEDRSQLTILVQLFGEPKLIKKVPPEAFIPPPEVDSAILHIKCFEKPLADEETVEEIFRLTKIAFGKRRKMLRNSIGELPDGMERLEKAGIEETRRPQTLSVEEWIKLHDVVIP